MPTFQGIRQELGVRLTKGPNPVRDFVRIPVYSTDQDTRVTGVTRDANGTALGNCNLILVRTLDNSVAALSTSDANGNYVIYASSLLTHYLVAYRPGSPDVAGTTVNTLVGT